MKFPVTASRADLAAIAAYSPEAALALLKSASEIGDIDLLERMMRRDVSLPDHLPTSECFTRGNEKQEPFSAMDSIHAWRGCGILFAETLAHYPEHPLVPSLVEVAMTRYAASYDYYFANQVMLGVARHMKHPMVVKVLERCLEASADAGVMLHYQVQDSTATGARETALAAALMAGNMDALEVLLRPKHLLEPISNCSVGMSSGVPVIRACTEQDKSYGSAVNSALRTAIRSGHAGCVLSVIDAMRRLKPGDHEGSGMDVTAELRGYQMASAFMEYLSRAMTSSGIHRNRDDDVAVLGRFIDLGLKDELLSISRRIDGLVMKVAMHVNRTLFTEAVEAMPEVFAAAPMDDGATVLHQLAEISPAPPHTVSSTKEAMTRYMMALMAAGIDINSLDARGQTPLHRAAQNGRVEQCQVLMDLGAHPMAKDSRGWTPATVAKVAKQPEVAALISSTAARRAAGSAVRRAGSEAVP